VVTLGGQRCRVRTFMDSQSAQSNTRSHIADVEVIGLLLQLAHILGLSVIAESVEKAGQFNWLRNSAAKRARACTFARARPPDQIPHLFTFRRTPGGAQQILCRGLLCLPRL